MSTESMTVRPSTGGAIEERAPSDASDDAQVRPPSGPGQFEQFRPAVIGISAIAAFMAVWQAVTVGRLVPALFLPSPSDIIAAYGDLISGGLLWRDVSISAQEVALGYVAAVAVGLPVGLAMGWYKNFNYALDPFVNLFMATPRIALIPLLIIWFGIGINSKIALIFLSSVFPIIINSLTGVRNLDTGLLKTAHSFGASDLDIFRTVALPGSVPFILAGLRLAVGHAMIAMVVGELVASQAGIGLMMATAGSTFQTGKVFAGLLIVAFTGVVFNIVLQRVETRFQSWRPVNR